MNLHDLVLYQAMNGEAEPSVTVEPLEVTENGEYSEEGKAYSPVTVDIANEANLIMTNIQVVNQTNTEINIKGFSTARQTETNIALCYALMTVSANSTKSIMVPKYSTKTSYNQYGCAFNTSVVVMNSVAETVNVTASAGTVHFYKADVGSSFTTFLLELSANNPTAMVTLTFSISS